MISLLVKVQAWQAQVAAQEASADPTHENTNMSVQLDLKFGPLQGDIDLIVSSEVGD